MSKLIKSPFECGFSNIEENYREGICRHPKNSCGNCPGPNFPSTCPLEEGVPVSVLVKDAVKTIHDWIYKKNNET